MKAAVAMLVLLVAGCTTSSSAPPVTTVPASPVVRDLDRMPMAPIHGRPLTGRTGLRFLLPLEQGAVLLDVDRGTTTPARAVPIPTAGPTPLVAEEQPARRVRLAGTSRVVTLPSSPGQFSDGIMSPDGRWIVVRMGDPAWPGPRQLLDLWLLDTRSLRWQHVPSMPAPVSLKQTNIAWTTDNRLVVLGRFDRDPDVSIDNTKDVLAVWRPGDPSLALRSIRLPADGAPLFFVR